MLQTARYSIDEIKAEARELVHQGRLSRQQPIYTLCAFLPSGQWHCVELELEENEYLLRDPIIDLLSSESWETD